MTATINRPEATSEEHPPCSDCGTPVTRQGAASIAKGSIVREPGEPLCGSCSASRIQLVRKCDALPNTLHEIMSRRMAR